MISIKEPSTMLISKSPFKSRLHSKRGGANWNPLTQPLGKSDFAALGIHPKNLLPVCQKLADIRAKLPPQFIRTQLGNWFGSLSIEERIAALTFRVPSITWLIKHIYTRCMIFGDSLFAFEVSQSTLSYTVTPDRSLYCTHPKANAERELIVGIRLANDSTPFDSLSVARDFVEDTRIFFKIMQDASSNKFGLRACRLTKTDKAFTWELPEWFDYGKPNTVGSWICANLERVLWLRYATFLTQGKAPFPLLSFTRECEILTEFWRGLGNEEKDKVLLDAAKGCVESAQEEVETRFELLSAIRVREAAFAYDAGKFIGWLFYITLSDIGMYKVQASLLNELRKLRSNKAANELLNEETSSSDLEKAKGKTVSSDPEDFIATHSSKKTKAGKQRAKRKKKAKKEDCVDGGADLLDEQEELALNITSSIITGALSKIEEEKAAAKLPAKSNSPKQKSHKPKPCKEKKQSKEKPIAKKEISYKEPIVVKSEDVETPLLDAAAVEVNYYKSAQNLQKKTATPSLMNALYSSITEEIAFLCNNLELHKKKQKAYQTKLISTLEDRIVGILGKQAEVQVYGSVRSGLDIESSDIDIGVTNLSLYSHEDITDAINKLAEHFRSHNFVCGVEPITTARIPLLKLVADMGKLFGDAELENLQRVDVVVSNESYCAVERGVESVEVTKNLVGRFRYLKEVTVVLKKLLAKKELNIPFKGGINSFAVLLLCAAYYSLYPDLSSPGEYLVGIMDFYAKYFNNMLYGIFFNGDCVYFTSSH